MCQKAEEIQKIRPRDSFSFHYSIKKEELLFTCFTIPKGSIWLPRQDQLQEMMNLKFPNLMNYSHDRYYSNLRCYSFHRSFEQFWLAFVMKERYSKTWNGKKWSWLSFWIKVVGEKTPQGTLANIYYIRNRLEIKNQINREMTNNGTCRQLVVIRDEGVILVSKEEITIVVIKERLKKEVNTTRRSIAQLGKITTSLDAPRQDKAKAQREISHYLNALDRKLQKTLKGKKKISEK